MNTSPVAAITGGAGALGSTLAKTLVTKGYKVALLDTERASGRLDELVSALGKDKAFAQAGDFSNAGAWSSAIDATKAALGSAPTHAALIAGGWGGGSPLHEAPDEVYERMMRTNVDTAYHAIHALLPSMVRAKSGSIVVVGSRAVERPWTSAGAAAYAASKSAVVTLAQACAQEVLEQGVRINAILPSTMDTAPNRASSPGVDFSKWVSLE